MLNDCAPVRIEALAQSACGDLSDLIDMANQADAFLRSHKWFGGASNGIFADGVPGVFAVFYFDVAVAGYVDLQPMWIIIGDVPPAYIDGGLCRDIKSAVEGYIGEMQAWVDAVQAGRAVEGLIPVLTKETYLPLIPTHEIAEMIDSRMDYIWRNFFPYFEPLTVGELLGTHSR